MEEDSLTIEVNGHISPRRVPCIITYISPFRIINSESLTPWETTLSEINSNRWNYILLHEIAGGFDFKPNPPYYMLITRDGGLAIPAIQEFRNQQKTLDFFNRCLAAILLGGIYCEAINADHLEMGSIIDWKYIRSQKFGQAASNTFHQKIRLRNASPLDSINLLDPRTEDFTKIQEAMYFGLSIIEKIPKLRADYLLKGTTGFARRDWGVALANFWIVIEQLISTLWEEKIIKNASRKERRKQLLDTRTWTAAARIEVLHQIGLIDDTALIKLYTARKSRNNLSHEGKAPTESDAINAYSSIQYLFEKILDDTKPKNFNINLEDHTISDPFLKQDRIIEPQFFMEILMLPGEHELSIIEASLRKKKFEKL